MNLHAFLFYVTLVLGFSHSVSSSFSASSSSLTKLYTSHCSFFVPGPTNSDISQQRYIDEHFGYYVPVRPGAPRTSQAYNLPDNLALRFKDVYETNVRGLFSVKALLTLYTKANTSDHSRPVKATVFASFRLFGFWSESRGNLCLIGHGVKLIPKPRSEYFPVSLKLYNLHNSSILTNLVTGSLESLVGPDQNDQNRFDPVSFMFFPTMNYEYRLVSQALAERGSTVESHPFSPTASLCSILPYTPLILKYSSQLPRNAKLEMVMCNEMLHSMRFLMRFPNDDDEIFNPRTFDPESTLLGEAVWDSQKGQLFVVLCRLLNATDSWAEARLGDCSTRMSLRFSEVWTLGNTTTLMGRFWSAKTPPDSALFEEIEIELSENYSIGITPMKYEYTKLEIAKKWCCTTKPSKRKKGVTVTYPDAFSANMAFDILSVKGEIGITRGYAQHVSLGNELVIELSRKLRGQNSLRNYPTNMSYLINLYNASLQSNGTIHISAEGIYDNSTGRLCMIGCKKIGLSSSVDCEILVNFQFPERNSKPNESFINGRIESKRKKTDPLYFEALTLSSTAEFRESIPIADSETNLALVSNSLTVIFAALQIVHLGRNPNLSPFVSATMLMNLILATLLKTVELLEAKPVAEIATTLFVLYSDAWILRIAGAARWAHENPRALWIAEISVLPIFSGFVFLVVFLADLSRSCSEILSSFFLLPQILLNAFRDSREEALSRSFYIGTSFATLLTIPRAGFDLYEAGISGFEFGLDLWDVMISLGSLVLAGIVYLQHKFGGRCILAFRSRESNGNEKGL